ncbi:hypothetical protein KCP70_23305 [Salmonella enterica subsp. enterica]|nr:hypothetical protein KCP70_23305 [Salmonella enterica subsp. enterica]
MSSLNSRHPALAPCEASKTRGAESGQDGERCDRKIWRFAGTIITPGGSVVAQIQSLNGVRARHASSNYERVTQMGTGRRAYAVHPPQNQAGIK